MAHAVKVALDQQFAQRVGDVLLRHAEHGHVGDTPDQKINLLRRPNLDKAPCPRSAR